MLGDFGRWLGVVTLNGLITIGLALLQVYVIALSLPLVWYLARHEYAVEQEAASPERRVL